VCYTETYAKFQDSQLHKRRLGLRVFSGQRRTKNKVTYAGEAVSWCPLEVSPNSLFFDAGNWKGKRLDNRRPKKNRWLLRQPYRSTEVSKVTFLHEGKLQDKDGIHLFKTIVGNTKSSKLVYLIKDNW